MSVLLVVAHPDDEALGAGGFAASLARAGAVARACILSGSVAARRHRPDEWKLRDHALRASELLGLGEPIFGDFPNISFNTVPHLDLVRFVEDAIELTGSTTIITHHPADLNDDHGYTSRACQAAVRLFQRKPGAPPLAGLHFMEVASSTDWAFAQAAPAFAPNAYVPLTKEDLDVKCAALDAYEGVMRAPPHPRSREAITALARYRGGQAGVLFAEAFQTVFQRGIGLHPSGRKA